MKDQNGNNVELKEEEMLEQKDEDQEVKMTSMLIVDKQKVETNTFTCSVQHDSSQPDYKVDIPEIQPKGNARFLFQ